MRTTLLRSLLLLLFLVGLRAAPATASHLVGGEMNYKYLDANGSAGTPFRYRITVLLYINWECTNTNDVSNVPDGRCNIFVNIYNKQNGLRLNSGQFAQNFNCAQVTCAGRPNQTDTQPQGSYRLPRVSNPSITPPLPGGCTLPGGPPPPVRLCRYEAIVELPVSFDGYYVVYTDGTRNRSINNLLQPDNQNQTIFVDMAPPLLPNTSPTFSDTAVVVICQGDTSIVVNNAVDVDGDRLIYSFSTPYNIPGALGGPPPTTFTPPPPSVTYNTGFSATAPFGPGAGNYAFLNASNGLSRYATSQQGRYVVAVEVKEFRKINGNEVLIGSTRREIQLVSRQCQPNQSPQFTAGTLANKTFTIEEGETLNFNLAATDPDGNPINLRVNSVLLDGSGPFDASFSGSQGVVQPSNPTGTVTITGTGGSVSGLFSFNSRCGNARSTLYDVVVTATDQACGAKSVADIFQIRVNRAAGPTSISGDGVICDQTQVRAYTAGGATPASYLWKVKGGAIQGSNSASSVQVRWNTTGAGRVTLQGVSTLGCPSDSVARDIDIRPASALAVTPTNATICLGGSTTLTASGAASYTWTGGNQTFTGPTITVAPTQTTTYTVTSTDGVCTTSRQVTVTVNQTAVANAGDDLTTCSGEAKTLGTAALTGYTYQWSPAAGLSSPTAAQPTFLQTNTGTTAQQFTYTVTATTAQGCTATDVVVVTLSPAAVANAGAAKTICSGGSTTIGTAPDGLAGRTYQWSPATGLSDPTAASPTVTLTNTGTAPLVVRYTLTVSTNQLCSTSAGVDVTVNPAAVANAGNDVVTCSGDSKVLGSTALTGYTYQWSPATGLSSATVAQPTFLQTNTGTTAQQFTYTLTATTAEGCTATDVVVVTLNPAAVADAGTSKTFCSGGSALLGNAASAVAGSSYLWSPSTGLSDPTAVAPTVTLTNTTSAPITVTYTLRVTTGPGCVDTKTVTVTVNPASVANAGNDVATCSGEAKVLGSAALTGYTYQWSPATGLSSTSVAQPTFLLTNTGTTAQQFTYTLTATTAQGCTATDVVVVTLNPAAVADAGTNRTFCSGGSAVLGNAASAVAGSSYLWSPATGLSSATAVAPTVTLTNTTSAPITTTYTLRVTTNQGCVDTKTVTVTVNPAAVANAGNDLVTCSGEPKVLGSAALTGYTYQWSPATGLSSTTAAQPTFLQTNTGTTPQQFTYTLTATTAEGCTATDLVVITLNPAAVANAGIDAALCDSKKVTLGTPGLTGYSYQWSPATDLSSATAARPELTAVNTTQSPITRTYTLTATTAQGCTSTDQVVVTINPRPLVDNIQGTASVCPTIQGVVYSIVNPRSTEYRWTVVGGTITSGDGTASITVNWGAANANASVQAFARNQFQCDSDPVTFPVVINQRLDTETPKGPASVCLANGPYTYSVLPTTGSIYAWQITGGTQISTGPGSVLVQWNGPGTGTVTVTETSNPNGGPITCFGQSQPLSVTILPSPAANLALAGPDRVCAGSTLSYSLPGAATGSTFQFTLDGATISNTGNTVSFLAPAPGTHILTVKETNASACAGPVFTKTFTVDPLPTAVTITGPASICPGPAGFGTQQYSVTNTPGSTYAWTVTGGTIVSGNGTSAIVVSFPAGFAARTVAVVQSSSFGCAGPLATLTVRPDNVSVALRAASVVPGDRSITVSLSVPDNVGNTSQVRILRRDAGTTATFAVVGNAANTAPTFTDTSVDADAKAYDYRVELLNNCGTTLASQEHTTIRTTATATEGSKDGRQEGTVKVSWNAYKGFTVKEYQLFRTAGTAPAQLVTTVSGSTLEQEFASSSAGFDQCFRVVAVSTDAGPAAVTAASNDACVNFANDLVFYNIITPNNDGVNDAFVVRNLGLYSDYTMSFYNRWGKEVYKTNSYANNWKAEEQPAGVYYYLLKLNSGQSYKGWFEVVK
ncbi:gliding motility-associated C-terminal domain-containing protein [Hymenobacter lucidus]|uniref:Gliding motility-associated C-terminal domain-containing protein n=1 Tax=Hymenobacter lucidus TaxID=2880930 RepID=A0ABS8ARU9_9BACT|nr:gliding motility-associated C-terminal domain-containing protein [Hymenobacter lucidus]MCB2408952.1 gliding motility-associated C-terminal domain-containing protein [Hymenobacter lucidus]